MVRGKILKEDKDDGLKRDAIKYIRDRAKAKYDKGESCRICGSQENLDFHHFSSLTALFEKYIKENGLEVTCIEDILSIRETFIVLHNKELYDDAVTLCKKHHQQLHSVYGSKPFLHTAEKQKRWVEIQRQKHLEKNEH